MLFLLHHLMVRCRPSQVDLGIGGLHDLGFRFIWYFAGWPLFGRLVPVGSDLTSIRPVDPEKMSLKSRASSQRLRAENIRLKALLDEASKAKETSGGNQQLQNLGVTSGRMA